MYSDQNQTFYGRKSPITFFKKLKSFFQFCFLTFALLFSSPDSIKNESFANVLSFQAQFLLDRSVR